jgi:hypothetical protein
VAKSVIEIFPDVLLDVKSLKSLTTAVDPVSSLLQAVNAKVATAIPKNRFDFFMFSLF